MARTRTTTTTATARTATATAATDDPARISGGLVLVDGHCLLCQASVRFLIPRDSRARLRFAPLQSVAAAGALRSDPETVLFLRGGRIYERSDAALRILGELDPPWSLLRVLLVVPRPLRDSVYGWIARHRYRWFGRSETCMVPPVDHHDRFPSGTHHPEAGPNP